MKCIESPDIFNQYFLSAVDNIVDKIPLVNLDPVAHIEFSSSSLTCWREVSPRDIITTVRLFRDSHSPDVYGISSHLLRHIIDVISVPLSNAINNCLRSGSFPDMLKISRTVPVFKRGDPSLMGSYRPISVIPAFAKVLETVIERQLCEYLEENGLLSDAQHGFRRGRSTVTALMDLVARIKSAFEGRGFASLALCDLSKAFDCISHQILLGKLERYGIGGVALDTFRSYLRNRQQVLSVHNTSSSPSLVHHGVPQGSVLGPILFLVAVNDLSLDQKTLLFADDTTLITVGRPLNRIVSETDDLLTRATLWFNSNKLKLNEDKTQRLICSLSQDKHGCENSVKLLGFFLDSKLTWREHTEAVCTRLSRVVYLLRRLVYCISRPYIVMAYHSLFHSHMLYGLVLWGHCSGSSDVFKLQKRAVRIISGCGKLEHCRPLFRRLGVLTLYAQYILDCVTYVRTHLESFKTRGHNHLHLTRRRSEVDIPFTRLSLIRDSFPNIAISFYNRLPENIRILNVPKFKTTIKQWLKDRPFYSIAEYFEEDFTVLSESTAM